MNLSGPRRKAREPLRRRERREEERKRCGWIEWAAGVADAATAHTHIYTYTHMHALSSSSRTFHLSSHMRVHCPFDMRVRTKHLLLFNGKRNKGKRKSEKYLCDLQVEKVTFSWRAKGVTAADKFYYYFHLK